MPCFTKYICLYRLDENKTLMLNTLTSAMDIVDNKTICEIKEMMANENEITNENDTELYLKLKKRGYIFNSRNDEEEILNNFKKSMELNKKVRAPIFPFEFIICPTMGCNLRCTYCFEEEHHHKDLKIMTNNQLDTIFNYIENQCQIINNLQKNKDGKSAVNPRIKLFGGEPLLKSTYPVVKRILEFANRNHLPISIITNGTSIDDAYFELLKRYHKMLKVQITLDGSKSLHDTRRIHADGTGSFEQVCMGIQRVLDSGTRLDLRINIDKENIYNLEELKIFFENQGWSKNALFYPYASPVRTFKPSDVSESVLHSSDVLKTVIDNGWYGKKDSFLKELLAPAGMAMKFFDSSNKDVKPWKKTYCEATSGSAYCFTPNGVIATCITYAGCKEHAIGHFDESGVVIDQDKLNMWMDRSPFHMEKCKDCKFILLCGGGCPAESLEKAGNINCPSCNDIEQTLKVYVSHIKDKLMSDANC